MMLQSMRKLAALTGMAVLWAAAPIHAEPQTPDQGALDRVQPNTWVVLSEEATGVREAYSPAFYYVPSLDRFVLSGGIARDSQHFDTEMFDAATRQWLNAYPDHAPYRKSSGPTDASSTPRSNPPFIVDEAGVSRIRMDDRVVGYSTGSHLFHQYAYNPDAGRLYAYFMDVTATYDPERREWQPLDVEKFTRTEQRSFHHIYGSMAHDPVNNQILSVGGTSVEDGGSPGVWAFDIASGRWERVISGSEAFRQAGGQAEALRREVRALVNRARNRFYVTESESDARRNLAAAAEVLADDVGRLAERLPTLGLGGSEAVSASVAVREAKALRSALEAGLGELEGAVARRTLLRLQEADDAAWRMARALDSEPIGRGFSQMATDRERGKIVLFGGSRVDGFLSDTWVYDLRTQTWEQRWPENRPSPRAGHTLAWLPQSRKIALWGGEIRNVGPQGDAEHHRELWIYDVERNDWRLLGRYEDGPLGSDIPGAVNDRDQLVVVSRGSRDWRDGDAYRARVTWGMQIDPDVGDSTLQNRGDSEPVAYGLTPGHYDRTVNPDTDAMAAWLDELPPNSWRLLPAPQVTTTRRAWGTMPYDSHRHQLLKWGGGHGTYIGTDLAHYSLRSGTWSIGYPAEDMPTRGFYAMAVQTFNNRPQVPNHVWDAAAYDPVSRKGIWMSNDAVWIYDPAIREWEYPPAPLPHPRANIMRISFASTPRGVVAWSVGRLYLLDATEGEWRELPVRRGELGGAHGDRTGMAYDSIRNSLWMGWAGRDIGRQSPRLLRYDMDDGSLERLNPPPSGIRMRETVHVPEIDMLVNIVRVRNGDEVGNLAYDIRNRRWVGLALPFDGEEQYITEGRYWGTRHTRTLHYDQELGVLIFHFTSDEIGVARLDPDSLETFELPEQGGS
ncbi:hypothetical protein B1C78_15535 [Thioalkalivibrio denitrificans]|uniref:Galactose oxidase n=1 Tax=Thioalkalivibrio denitrificans TaxID=108003 RepID=A0A1V3NB15_9GAMM|nr:kelch repeat-containing protein [Thioalkalivibrio denitrificans]OOG22022.1 hypothetical protein B1C78_15535 [Thioalkalivibrio denitrificans]